MFKSKVNQRKVYLPDELRDILHLENGDKVTFRVLQNGNIPMVVIEKDISDFVQMVIFRHQQEKKGELK